MAKPVLTVSDSSTSRTSFVDNSTPESTVVKSVTPDTTGEGNTSEGSTSNKKRTNVTVTTTEVKPTRSKSGSYRFLNSSRPHDARGTEHRRAVRSQAARLLPVETEEGDNEKSSKHRRRRRTPRSSKNVTFRIDLRVSKACARSVRRSEEATPAMETLSRNAMPQIPMNPFGSWAAPFGALRTRHSAFAPGLMHHCECSYRDVASLSFKIRVRLRSFLLLTSKTVLTVMAVDMPELDLLKPGLLRSSWFPMALAEPACFAVIFLSAASHFAAVHSMQRTTQLLVLRAEALRLINQLLLGNCDTCSDGAIAAVAKMASYEAQFGNKDYYGIHMQGLKRMLRIRGGLGQLGLDGLLMRMILWIDINAHHIVRTPLYIAQHDTEAGMPLPPPNPGMYIGEGREGSLFFHEGGGTSCFEFRL